MVSAAPCAIYGQLTNPWTNGSFNFGNGGTSRLQAQQFTVASTCTVDSISVDIAKIGTPTDHATVAIYSDSGGAPNAALETGSNVDPTTTSNTFANATSTFLGTLTLNTSTTYWVVLGGTGAGSGTNLYDWAANNASVPYGNGARYDGTSWISSGGGYNRFFVVNAVATPAPVPTPDDGIIWFDVAFDLVKKFSLFV